MRLLDQLALRDREGRALGRHAILLATLVFMLVALPLLEWSAGRSFRFPLLFSLVLMAAVWVNRTQHWILWAAVLGGIGALGGNAMAVAVGSNVPRIAGDICGLALLALTTFVILNSVVQTRRVELDTVIGGICVYLLIGLSFTTVYRLLIDLAPGSFMMGSQPLEESFDDASSLPARLLYFSFITLTTTGLGDITPKSEIAQMLTAGEALTGQLYVAIFVARLMGLHIEAGRLRTETDDPDPDSNQNGDSSLPFHGVPERASIQLIDAPSSASEPTSEPTREHARVGSPEPGFPPVARGDSNHTARLVSNSNGKGGRPRNEASGRKDLQ